MHQSVEIPNIPLSKDRVSATTAHFPVDGQSHSNSNVSHVNKLEQELLLTKQSLARHLLRSRTLEKTIIQYRATEQAIRSLASRGSAITSVNTRAGTSALASVDKQIPYKLGAKAVVIKDESILQRIESMCPLKTGFGIYLLNVLNSYSDDDMQEEILQLTKTVIFELNIMTFVAIVQAASKGKLSAFDGESIYHSAVGTLNHIASKFSVEESSYSLKDLLWKLLIVRLRKKLRTAFLATNLQKMNLSTSATSSIFSVAKAPGALSRVLEGDIRKEQHDYVLGAIKGSGKQLRGNAKKGVNAKKGRTVLSSTSLVDPRGAYNVAPTSIWSASGNRQAFSSSLSAIDIDSNEASSSSSHILSNSLVESKQTQLALSNKIINTLSIISQDMKLISESKMAAVKNNRGGEFDTDPKAKYKSAIQFARKMGCLKLEQVLTRMCKRELVVSLSRWKRVAHQLKDELVVSRFMKYVGAVRLANAISYHIKHRVAMAFTRWLQKAELFDSFELLAAIVEIQRVVRGILDRRRVRAIWKQIAATHLQRMWRGYAGRKLYTVSAHQKKLKMAVLLIENAWLKLRWFRLFNRRKEVHRQEQSVLLLQRVYRGFVVRKLVYRLKFERKQLKCAIKIQSVYRMYRAVLRVLALILSRKRTAAAIHIQRIIRGKLSRNKYLSRLHLHTSARVIALSWLCYRARCIRRTLFINFKAREIQRVFRGCIYGRKLAKQLRLDRLRIAKMKLNAISYLERFIVGFAIRRKFRNELFGFKQTRKFAAIVLQSRLKALILGFITRKKLKLQQEQQQVARMEAARLEREREMALAASMALEVRQAICVVSIQRVARGMIVRNRGVLNQLRKERELQEQMRFIRSRGNPSANPIYYRLQREYFTTQNLFHRPYLVKIQSRMRVFLAKKELLRRKQTKGVIAMQTAYFKFSKSKKAVAKLNELKLEKANRIKVALIAQRLCRRFLARLLLRRLQSARRLYCFLCDVRAMQNAMAARDNFRRMRRAAVMVQAIVRRYLTRKFFMRNYKRLVKERNKRVRIRRHRAAILIQGLARIIAAKRILRRKRKELELEMKAKAKMDALEDKIDNIHDDWMQDLLSVRAQSGARGFVARQQVKKKRLTQAEEAEQAKEARRHSAATKIQSLVRGVLARAEYKRQLPYLRKARQMRGFCVECETKVATKRCRVCKDNYCDSCYASLHKKGTRSRHDWEPMRQQDNARNAVDVSMVGNERDEYSHTNSNTGKRGRSNKRGVSTKDANSNGNGNNANVSVNRRADWEQFYDENAKAKYWFNSKTGEASWTTPKFDG